MYKLCVFVPESHLEPVKQAVFAAGAGRIGNYEHCCWQTLGTGQFRPLPGSQPHLGQLGELEQVPEWKLELVLEADRLASVMEAMYRAHPYEEPAFDLIQLVTFKSP